jgi:hypothetical protein
MRPTNLLLTCALALCFSVAVAAQSAPNRNFIPVEGAGLQAKMDAAVKLGSAGAQATRFWTAYAFDVRPGVAVDFEFVDDDGSRNFISGDFISFGGGSSVFSVGSSSIETRNLAVFLLRTPDTGAVVRVEVFNLERKHEYSSYPVYWLGRAANEESLTLLRGLVGSSREEEIAESATRAIALHDDRRVGDILEAFARSANFEDVRSQAVYWLGRTPPVTPARQAFFAELARNERESNELRKRAISAYGLSQDAATLNTLVNLYSSIAPEELRKSVLSAVAHNDSRDAINFLIKVARTDPDAGMRKKALNHLGNKAGDLSLGALTGTVEQSDAETEVQKQAVVALSRRPNDESVPLLLKVARTHRKPEVRKEALRLLGRTGDERALELFRELLSK